MSSSPPQTERDPGRRRASEPPLAPADEVDDFLAELRAPRNEAPENGNGDGDGDRSTAAAAAEDSPTPTPVRVRRGTAILHTARELAPAWWLARAYVAAAGLTLALGLAWSTAHPAFPRLAGPLSTVLLLLALAVGSVALGLAARRRAPFAARRRSALAALNLVLALAAVPVAARLLDPMAPVRRVAVIQEIDPIGQELSYDGILIRNVYPYSRDGRPLHDVLLYDEFGRPLDLGAPRLDPDRRVLVTGRRAEVLNSFPILYYEPGTRWVAHPNAGFRVRPPHVTGAAPAPRRTAAR